MSSGVVREMVTCSSVVVGPVISVGGTSVGCTRLDGSAGTLQIVSSYSIDPTQQAFFDNASVPLDYSVVSAIWGSVFCFVLGLYLVSKSVGTVLSLIRR